jgi:predicted nucleotidyltransferase
MPPGTEPVILLGDEMAGLVAAVGRVATAEVGRYAIVGGVAVTVRLGSAHRATSDVDAVVDDARIPTAFEVLTALPEAIADPNSDHRVRLDGTKVELLPVGTVADDDLEGIPEKDALFVGAHAWALETASSVDVLSHVSGDRVTAQFATPAALVAMKLHAIEDRSPTSGVDKRAGDGSDIFELLVRLNADGSLEAELAGLAPNLRGLVARATDRVLVSGAARTRSWMRSGDAAAGSVTADELRSVGEPLLAALT